MIMYYDKHGNAIVHLQNNHLFDLRGKPLAFVSNKAVFNLRGKHLGYIEDGWIRDKRSCAVLYTDGHIGYGPIPPIPPIPPVASASWSSMNATEFFNQ